MVELDVRFLTVDMFYSCRCVELFKSLIASLLIEIHVREVLRRKRIGPFPGCWGLLAWSTISCVHMSSRMGFSYASTYLTHVCSMVGRNAGPLYLHVRIRSIIASPPRSPVRASVAFFVSYQRCA